jgi:hypothetical protein
MYGWATDANITQASIPGTPVAPDATYPRKDIYFIRVNDSSAGDGSGLKSAPVEYLAGTPNASPVAPALPARSFLIATVTVPQAGAGSPTVLVNPARFVAAGGIQPASQAERAALSPYDGLTVRRTDLAGRPTETYNGTGWRSPVEAAAVVTDGEWAATGQVTRILSPDGRSMVSIGEEMSRTGGSFTMDTTYKTILTGFIPTGYQPLTVVTGWALLTASDFTPRAQVWWRVNTVGKLEARLDSGSTSLNTGDRIYLSGNWTTA